MTSKKRIVIIGATSAMAEHCARLWAKDPANDFVLVARNTDKLKKVADDLRVRNPNASIEEMISEFEHPADIQPCVDTILQKGAADIVLIAFGTHPDQKKCEQDLALSHDALMINGVTPVLFAEAFIKDMEKNNHGALAIIGSVAGDRGRKVNYVYGSAKGLVDRYTQGLSHRLAAQSKVHVVLIKPGPTQTPMTAHIQKKMASVEEVAKDIVDGIEKKKSVIYTPKIWAIIMLVVRHLPRMIFNKLNI